MADPDFNSDVLIEMGEKLTNDIDAMLTEFDAKINGTNTNTDEANTTETNTDITEDTNAGSNVVVSGDTGGVEITVGGNTNTKPSDSE